MVSLRVMDPKLSAIERAFQIARTGHATSSQDIKYALIKEGYPPGQIEGPSLSRQLMAIITVAREKDSIRRTWRRDAGYQIGQGDGAGAGHVTAALRP
jgi:hypothetical protein